MVSRIETKVGIRDEDLIDDLRSQQALEVTE